MCLTHWKINQQGCKTLIKSFRVWIFCLMFYGNIRRGFFIRKVFLCIWNEHFHNELAMLWFTMILPCNIFVVWCYAPNSSSKCHKECRQNHSYPQTWRKQKLIFNFTFNSSKIKYLFSCTYNNRILFHPFWPEHRAFFQFVVFFKVIYCASFGVKTKFIFRPGMIF